MPELNDEQQVEGRNGLMLNMRFPEGPRDMVLFPDSWAVKQNCLILQWAGRIREVYNMDLIERFEVLDADQAEEAMEKLSGAPRGDIDLTKAKENNPFRRGPDGKKKLQVVGGGVL